ncbi:endogenous retrovirus group S71 member 1 Env polyprotein-like [Erinaceus europaeus]|uniref:Endogenous retrovirus group S71 member 1 Env polyprotein-like n=1 Tax=Erinaceus europaeus TaxID=9365 RepID=A0ABM3Y7U8_ERIEU|nr:endogenous retrovirus group S71 member 1 Env polyprotein-like [Erinaceus europaeus]
MKIKTWHKTDAWRRGKKWGIRLVFTGEDPGALFTIQQKPWSHAPVGPLQPIHLGQNPRNTPPPPAVADVSPNFTGTRRQGTNASFDVHPLVEPLVRSAELMYNLLNDSAPNITQDCWLCLHPEPPYYIGVAVEAQIGPGKGDITKISLSSGSLNSPECKWGTQLHQVTLRDVQGKGTCFVTEYYQLGASLIWDASPYRVHCSHTIKASRTQEWSALLKAPEGTWWVCTSRMAPCVTFWGADQEELCILTHILPRLYYAHGGTGWAHLRNQEEAHLKHKRAPVLVPLLAGAAIAGSIAVGATALAKEETIVKLDQQVDQDLRTLEDLMEALEGSLSSLAEVVLQNRRGLDLLFLRHGGLCVALNEACCFYANHSGLVRKSLSEVKRRIGDRAQKWKELRESNWFKGNWFSNWFSNIFSSWPSWLKTLVATIAGPLITLLLIVTLGPCLWRTLVSMIQQRTGKVMNLETYLEANGGHIYYDTDYDSEEEKKGEEESRI